MNAERIRLRRFTSLILASLLGLAGSIAGAQTVSDSKPAEVETHWIWSPAHTKDLVPPGDCYFRQTIELAGDEVPTLQITADDRYEAYINGQRVGKGESWKSFKTYDVQDYLKPGRNSIAIKATNTAGGSAGMVARFAAAVEGGGAEVLLATDATWKTSLKEADGWETAEFDDSQWVPARSFGLFGPTEPWANQVASEAPAAGRFLLGAEFRVEQVIAPENCGSLMAMTFNEWGEIIASQEGEGLIAIVDGDQDGLVETVTTYCDKIKNCQGLLALNGQIFAVGEGPEGTGFYRLSDEDQDGVADAIKLLFEFDAQASEHGPHAPVLGPDGLIYLVIGNHCKLKQAADESSPYHHYYEGDLLQPRYEDPNGHAVGVKAPGGAVLRTNTEGSQVQLFAGGFRNPYDIAFNKEGELFAYDADMEWDLGLPWYRPTRVNHVTAGGEYGWRSGWAKWPSYYLDNLPAVIETERGSPTGVVFYNHYQYPVRYHNAMFACDWSQGTIVAVRMQQAGASYQAQREVFLEGRPLNATDLDVGPDGWLYFATGGRGTEGGVYRIVWTGKAPPQPKLSEVMQAVRQPQLQSAWGRQQVASIQQTLGSAEWGRQLTSITENATLPIADRVQALDLMQLVGPFPTPGDLVKLARDPHAELRVKAAYLMGIHVDPACQTRLIELLGDNQAIVRRIACNSLARGGYRPDPAALVPLLGDSDRFVAWAAARALERLPLENWASLVIESENARVFLTGAAALLALEPPDETVDFILTRGSELMNGFLSDDDFVDLLRVFQIGLQHGKLTRKNVPDLCSQLEKEYPANEAPNQVQRINRELMRLLAYLQEPSIIPRSLKVLESEAPLEEKLHVACCLRFIDDGWTVQQKLALVEFFEKARDSQAGHSFAGYIDNVSRDFLARFNDDERQQVLSQAARWPASALLLLASLPEKLDSRTVSLLIEMNGRVPPNPTPAMKRLATGLIAVLGGSRDPAAMAHLREQYEKSPERREDLAMGLAQSPGGENWPLLLRALSVVEGVAAQEVLSQLARVDQSPEEPEPIRQAILCGLKLGENGGPLAAKLLTQWTGEKVSGSGDKWDEALAAWQRWFQENYPDEPAPELPAPAETAKWDYHELLGFLTGDSATQGNPGPGEAIFAKSQCVKCHRFGNRGDGVGPDLSTVSQRFQRKEILESLMFPSQVISDQYASKTITTEDGQTITGIVAPLSGTTVAVLQANGEKVTIRKDEISETAPSKKSIMPEGLLNQLTLEEIADLFAYLGTTPKATKITIQQPASRRRK
ncbi:MAG TPA: HEAT repeat domain-containing protein [Pirellulales bacterium]|nr:HEAT repeat domain-containing protein [Pirellulales bacterium]